MNSNEFCLAWEQKVWGRVAHLNEPDVSVSVLDVKKGFRCSRHYHTRRWNYFRVIRGRIRITMYKQYTPGVLTSTSERVLGPGESFDVPPLQIHSFAVEESGQVVEIYWTTDGTKVDFRDITRFDEGGPVDV